MNVKDVINKYGEDINVFYFAQDVQKIMEKFNARYPSEVKIVVSRTSVLEFKTFMQFLNLECKLFKTDTVIDIDRDKLIKWCSENKILYEFSRKMLKELIKKL